RAVDDALALDAAPGGQVQQLAQGGGVFEALGRERIPRARAEQPRRCDETGERPAVVAKPGDAGLDAAHRLAFRQGPELTFAAGVDAAAQLIEHARGCVLVAVAPAVQRQLVAPAPARAHPGAQVLRWRLPA